ncbi:MAG: hypothetical protein Q7T34_02295, partial [Candidatus Parcubacteria bacterium]|nr:hypothetical protein [Candidatus Parcubacteria bacterium]
MKNRRITLILAVSILSGAAIVVRLFSFQVSNHELYSALAKGQQSIQKEEISDRGEILMKDKNGILYELAVNKEWPLVYISPNEQKLTSEAKTYNAEELSKILSVDKDIIIEKFNKNSLYEVIKTRISNEEFKEINDLNLKGV